MIQTNYDPEADVLHVSFGLADAVYEGATEVAPGVYLDFCARAGSPPMTLRVLQSGAVQATMDPWL